MKPRHSNLCDALLMKCAFTPEDTIVSYVTFSAQGEKEDTVWLFDSCKSHKGPQD